MLRKSGWVLNPVLQKPKSTLVPSYTFLMHMLIYYFYNNHYITLQACHAVVSYLNTLLDNIYSCLEGENLNAVTLELAVRLHRVIYEHLQNFQFNSAGW